MRARGPSLTFAPLETDPQELLARVPAGPGVGQFLGPGGRNLLLGQPANLRKWASAHLGLGPPPPAGRRPRTNLSGIATSLGWLRTVTSFEQRLRYERLSAPLVPLAERRDLKPPAFLHLDPGERFPRVSVRDTERGVAALFGPFRSRRAAETALDAVNRLFGLRPCDLVFEPDPVLPLGLGCLYAQVESCSAPCLSRVGEQDYRAVADRAASWLARPESRSDAPEVVPAAVTGAEGALAVVVSAGRKEVGLYPVREGRVLDAAAQMSSADRLDALVASLHWPVAEGPDDWPWLAAWLASPRGRGSYVPVLEVNDRAALSEAVRRTLPERFARPSPGGNVGASRGET